MVVRSLPDHTNHHKLFSLLNQSVVGWAHEFGTLPQGKEQSLSLSLVGAAAALTCDLRGHSSAFWAHWWIVWQHVWPTNQTNCRTTMADCKPCNHFNNSLQTHTLPPFVMKSGSCPTLLPALDVFWSFWITGSVLKLMINYYWSAMICSNFIYSVLIIFVHKWQCFVDHHLSKVHIWGMGTDWGSLVQGLWNRWPLNQVSNWIRTQKHIWTKPVQSTSRRHQALPLCTRHPLPRKWCEYVIPDSLPGSIGHHL